MERSGAAASIDPTAVVAATAVIGAPPRPLLGSSQARTCEMTVIGARCWIGHGCLVGAGARLGAGAILDDGVAIECDVRIGERALVTHGARVGAGADVGDDCVIGGYVCERAVVDRGARVFGALIHEQRDPSLAWDAAEAQEPSPSMRAEAFVGWGARVIGPVEIGERAYVCAGATVTRSVPPCHVAFGVNRIVPHEEWRGELGRSRYFRR